MKIGVISDTHNLLRPEVLSTLSEVDLILHGGDIAEKKILDQLYAIAPVYAVKGNNDKEWAEGLPVFLDMEIGGIRIYMTHKKKETPDDTEPYDLIIYGHSHKFEAEKKKKTVFLNPGCCGPRKSNQEITMAVVEVEDGKLKLKKIEIPHQEMEEKVKKVSKKK